jgi:hypothetical protein
MHLIKERARATTVCLDPLRGVFARLTIRILSGRAENNLRTATRPLLDATAFG